MARPAGGPRKGCVELQPAVPGGSLRGWVYSRREGGRHFPRVPGSSLPAHAGTALGHPRSRAHGREPQGGVPGGPPSPPRRPGPGREQGGRGAASDGTPGPGLGGGAGGFPAGGTAESRLPPRPASSGFPIRRDRAGQRGRGRALSRSPPPAHKGRGLERGADAGGGAGGKGRHSGRPPPAEANPSQQPERVQRSPDPGEVDAHPAETKGLPIPPAKGGP